MGIEGKLEEIALVDVMQMLHLTRKTGELTIESPSGGAMLNFREGDLIAARHPSRDVDIGRVLTDLGYIDKDRLLKAVWRQEEMGAERLPLASTMIEMGMLSVAEAHEGLRKLVELTVVEIISWDTGKFNFETGASDICDSFQYFPDDLGTPAHAVDTQMIMMDALRIFDERNRTVDERADEDTGDFDLEFDRTDSPPDAPAEDRDAPVEEQKRPEIKDILGTVGDEDAEDIFRDLIDTGEKAEPPKRKVLLFTTQQKLVAEFEQAALHHNALPIIVDAADYLEALVAAGSASDQTPPVLIEAASGADESALLNLAPVIKNLRRKTPEVPIYLLTQSITPAISALSLEWETSGCVPIGDLDPEMRRDLLSNCIAAGFREQSRKSSGLKRLRRQVSVLKKRMQFLSKRAASMEISLAILQFMADMLERSIIFMVRPDDLLALGSFGLEKFGWANQAEVMKIKIPLQSKSLLGRVVEASVAYQGPAPPGDSIEEHLFNRIGKPAAGDIILLPLVAGGKVSLLIYGDFGSKSAPSIYFDILEIMAAYAGMAFENAMLRRGVGASGEKIDIAGFFNMQRRVIKN